MRRVLRWAAAAMAAAGATVLAGCGSPPELTLEVSGTAAEAYVSYLLPDGTTGARTVELPFPISAPAGSAGSFRLYAANLTGAGTLQCSARRGDESLGSSRGTVFAGCAGSYEGDAASLDGYSDVWPEDYLLPAAVMPGGVPGPLLFLGQRGTAFMRGDVAREDEHDLYVLDLAAGPAPRALTAGFFGTCPTWSPDGTRILFQRIAEPAGWFAMDLDGSGIVQLSGADGNPDLCAEWSPDGSRIAFGARPGGNTALNQILVAAADGSGATQITRNADPEVGYSRPTWSPDGARIAFVAESGPPTAPDGQIFVMNADGSEQSIVFDPPDRILDLDWSPDGSRLLYVCHSGVLTPRTDICTVGLDGSGQRQVTDGSFTGLWQANWSPDGRYVIFAAERGGEAGIYAATEDGLVFRLAAVDPGLEVYSGWLDWYPGPTPAALPAEPYGLPFPR